MANTKLLDMLEHCIQRLESEGYSCRAERDALWDYSNTATPPADAALADEIDSLGFVIRGDNPPVKEWVIECGGGCLPATKEEKMMWDVLQAALRARAVPEGFVMVPAGIKSVDRDFEYDASEEMHIPKVVVRFAPGKDTDAQTWDGRDKLAWSITQASRALLAASKGGAE